MGMENIILSFVLLNSFSWNISLNCHLSPRRYLAYHFKHLREEEKTPLRPKDF